VRYIVELPASRVEAITSLIDSGRYKDIQSFILTALENQLYLEKEPLDVFARRDFTEEQSFAKESVQVPSSRLLALGPESAEVIAVEEPSPDVIGAETLWALYNRIFPIKVTLRVLANILRSNPTKDGFVDLATVQDVATEQAVVLFKLLSRVDKKSHRMIGEKLTAGLPRSTDRARDRYRLHFVGSINSKSCLEGAPAILRFVNMRKDESGKAQIGLTESGIRFTEFENPILDRQDHSCALSAEEANFYMQHIAKKLEKEYRLCNVVLKAIANDHNTPDELTQIVQGQSLDLEKEEAQAVRSSLVSRLSELGLLTRKRKGLNVTYVLTPRGHELAATHEELVGNETC
jgi:predicted transcriptional regulator